MMALNETVYKIVAYNDMERYDSVEYIFDEAFSQLSAYYGIKYASRYSVLPIKSFLSMKKFDRVRNCLNNYERESGYMDSMGNVSQGHEIYYFYKGQYYLETNRLDSAELFFRKELTAKDHNNQNAASFGLAQLYQQKSMPDSAAKYALYSYAMNDSANNELATNVIAVSQAMYDYSRHQRQAELEREKTTQTKKRLYAVVVLSAIIIICMIIIAGVTVLVLQLNRKNMLLRYHRKVEELTRAQTTLNQMRQQENLSAQEISIKEQKILLLQTELDALMVDEKVRHETEKGLMDECGLSSLLDNRSASGQMLSEDEWNMIDQFISEHLPSFCEFLENQKSKLGLFKSRLCILLRFRVGVKGAASMLGVSSPYVSKISGIILSDLFHTGGSGKKLTRYLSTIV